MLHEHKTALIWGGGGSLGSAMARAFARGGARLSSRDAASRYWTTWHTISRATRDQSRRRSSMRWTKRRRSPSSIA
jgi:NAD(P)-dependent dehydrogenase (short-subunit alcohol dehydrogenase family)